MVESHLRKTQLQIFGVFRLQFEEIRAKLSVYAAILKWRIVLQHYLC